MKLLFQNLPTSLSRHRETLRLCLEAMDRELPFEEVVLFGSHARGEAREDSDVDLCVVSVGADRQVEAGNRLYCSLRGIWPRPGFTLVPIIPERFRERCAGGDFFYKTVTREGVALATQHQHANPGD